MKHAPLFILGFIAAVVIVKSKKRKPRMIEQVIFNKIPFVKYTDQLGHSYLASYVMNDLEMNLLVSTHMRNKELTEIFN